MNNDSKPLLWMGLFTAIILGLAWQFIPLTDAKNRMNALPLKGIGYIGQNLPLHPREQDLFKEVNVLKRIYRVKGKEYFISILDGTNNRHIVHDPYYCFTGGGWEIENEQTIFFKNGYGKQVNMSNNGKKKVALFWFSNGISAHGSPFRYWLEATLRRITLGLSGAEPVLIFVQSYEESDTDWNQFTQDFSSLLGV